MPTEDLLLRTPGPVPLWDLSSVLMLRPISPELVSGLVEFQTSLGTSVLPLTMLGLHSFPGRMVVKFSHERLHPRPPLSKISRSAHAK